MSSTSAPASANSAADFAGALAASDHGYAFTVKFLEARMLARVTDELGRQIAKGFGPEFLMAQPGRDHDAAGAHCLAVIERQAKAVGRRLDRAHGAAIDIRDRVTLKPFAVTDEMLERQQPVGGDAMGRRIGVERERAGGVGNVGCAPRRAQHHAFRHIVPPERHRLAEYGGCDAGGLEMGGNRQPIGAGADDGCLAGIASS